MRLRGKTKLDANHAAIVQYLRAHGVFVCEILDPVDVMTHGTETGLMEIKISGARHSTRKQLEFIALCPVPVAFVENEDEALTFARNPREKGLTLEQQHKLLCFIQRNPDVKKFEYRQIKKLIF
jgi:hypothetical protein